MLGLLRPFLWLVSRSRLSILGASVTLSAFLAEFSMMVFDHFRGEEYPYLGMIVYGIMPGVIGGGLALIPLGLYLAARKEGGGKVDRDVLRRIATRTDWAFAERLGYVVSGATLLNVTFFTFATYEGYHYMDSSSFCGLVCHQVMEPEYTAYMRGSHAGVECVECHIGPGADFFVKAKISGAWQMVAVTLNTYPRPIEAPVKKLRPARDTCEQCHNPSLFRGNRVRVIRHYAEDEGNTPRYTVLNLRIGGGEDLGHPSEGIHSHVSDARTMTYDATDDEWNDVVRVTLTDSETGETKTWRRLLPSGETPEVAVTRTMDCVDCHNRTAHEFLPPIEALEERMQVGEIDPSLPWIRKEGLEVLEAEYASVAEAEAGIGALSDRYAERYPAIAAERAEDIAEAEAALLSTWRTFVWPDMNIQWGTYKARDTHEGTHGGCYRCHNDDMLDEEGLPMSSECEACHYVLSEDERDPEVFQCLNRERSVPIF